MLGCSQKNFFSVFKIVPYFEALFSLYFFNFLWVENDVRKITSIKRVLRRRLIF
uniref:Candidate secreted effector n=1 Tax=Meloidogyne incognita TaxID=6306 RepID=A0A914LPN5_MELIC